MTSSNTEAYCWSHNIVGVYSLVITSSRNSRGISRNSSSSDISTHNHSILYHFELGRRYKAGCQFYLANRSISVETIVGPNKERAKGTGLRRASFVTQLLRTYLCCYEAFRHFIRPHEYERLFCQGHRLLESKHSRHPRANRWWCQRTLGAKSYMRSFQHVKYVV